MNGKKTEKKPIQTLKEPKKLSTSIYTNRSRLNRSAQTSNIKFGWDGSENNATNSSFMKYHNQSNFDLCEPVISEDIPKKQVQRRMKTEELNSKLPTFDPKLGNKSNIVFGDEKPDFKKKEQAVTSSRVPPGGRTQIFFG